MIVSLWRNNNNFSIQIVVTDLLGTVYFQAVQVMDSFFTSGDKTSAAQEEFCAHFQTSNLNPKDTHNVNKGIDVLVMWVGRWCWVAGGGSGSLVAGVLLVIMLQLFGH